MHAGGGTDHITGILRVRDLDENSSHLLAGRSIPGKPGKRPRLAACWKGTKMSIAILEKLRSAENLPSLPVVALEVLRLARSETASAAEIARTIEHDPALASKVLKVANWPCSDVPPDLVGAAAMRILGLRTVKVMALTFSLTDLPAERETALTISSSGGVR